MLDHHHRRSYSPAEITHTSAYRIRAPCCCYLSGCLVTCKQYTACLGCVIIPPAILLLVLVSLLPVWNNANNKRRSHVTRSPWRISKLMCNTHCVYVCIRVYTCIYVCIHTYIHTTSMTYALYELLSIYIDNKKLHTHSIWYTYFPWKSNLIYI